MAKRDFVVLGLDCAEEVSLLKGTVGKLDGVSGLDFSLLDGTMSVTYDPEVVDQEGITAAVESAGLRVRTDDEEEASGFWATRGRRTMCIAGAVLTLAGFLSHAVLHHSLSDALVGGEGIADHVFPLVSRLFYLSAVITGGWFVFPRALASLRRRRADMNLLMSIAVVGALFIGQWFEAAAVAVLFSFSLLLESWSVERARRSIRSLMDLTPPTARYICPHDGDLMEKPVAEVPLGATVLVRPGEKFPLDGILSKGSTEVNQAPVTGESAPVVKEPGDEVFAGTINETAAVEFTSTRPASDTTISRIIRMVEDARSRRAPSEQWVEKFARYYTPAMINLALLIALVPPLFFGGSWSAWFYEALVILVIACPCALVISTPVSIVSALAAAARSGVLIKGGAHLEAAARLKAVALDKTGTITSGRPEVQEVVPLNGHTEREVLERAAAMEAHSDHPLAQAILRRAEAAGLGKVTPAERFDILKGRGAEAILDGRRFWLGSHRLLHEKGQETPEIHEQLETMAAAGYSVVTLGNENHVCGLISVADDMRPEAPAVVADLRRTGIVAVAMLTGDNRGTAEAIAARCGIREIHAELLPEDKLGIIKEIAARYGRTAMVGDGINDAPALAAADLGIAMGAAGTDAAIETADIALMADDLTRLPWLVRHAQRALRIIRQNIAFALGLKLLFMGLALAEVATLWMAVAADMGASLLVIANGLRLLQDRQEFTATSPGPGSATAKPGTPPG